LEKHRVDIPSKLGLEYLAAMVNYPALLDLVDSGLRPT
jgi:hypothetical protein